MSEHDLDDFDLERTRVEADQDTRAAQPPLAPARASVFPLLLVGAAIVALAGLALVYFAFRTPKTPPPALAAAPVPAAATAGLPSPSASPALLPSLDGSDDFVRRLAANLSKHPELLRWLAQPALVRTLTAVVANVADGETPRPHLAFLAPAQRFRAKGRAGRIAPDPAGFAGYDRFADAVSSLDTVSLVSTYRTLEPLFDAAYKDLGHPEGGFRSALDRGVAALLAAPVPAADVALVPHATGFRYAEARLEGLTAAQKQLLRLGPRNTRLVQAKLGEWQAALAATPR